MRRFLVLIPILAVVLAGLFAARPATMSTFAQEATPAGEDEPEGVEFIPLAFAPLAEVPSTPAVVGLLRATLEPGSTFAMPASPQSSVAVLEEGSVSLEAEGAVTVTTADQMAAFEPGEEVAAGTETTLNSGDTLSVPSDTAHQLRNDGQETAVVVVAFVGPFEDDPAQQADATPEATSPPGVTLESLGFGIATELPDPSYLAIARVTYEPGVGEEPAETDSAVLAYIEEGAFAYTLESGETQITRGLGAATPGAEAEAEAGMATPGTEVTLAAGDTVFEQVGTVSGVRNAGDEPATALFAAVVPAEEFEEGGTPEAGTPEP